MSEPLLGVIVSHAAVAHALVSAVEAISGLGGALVPVSNEGCDYDALADRLRDAVQGRQAVLFVDLPGGSCLIGAARFARGRPDLAVVTGVNLAMLLDFVLHRDATPGAAARRAAGTGAEAIGTPAA